MGSHSDNNKRIAKNTIVLYFRMIFLMCISLYTSRVILATLGVTDYGIYNVVGGFVSMFALISSALTAACTRFLNFEMGKGNLEKQKILFSTIVIIQCLLAVIITILGETVGVWYVNNIMVLPEARLHAANCCFQISILNFVLKLITIPYNASIVAHEKMNTFAFISIFQGLANLGICFLIQYNPFDRLVYYALLSFLISFIILLMYRIYAIRHFEECKFRFVFDKPVIKEIFSYSVWQILGNSAMIMKKQGVNMVLNYFFGPVVNAARGVATQVLTAVNGFSHNFMMAMNPQMTQSYARGDYKYTINLMYIGSRYSYYLMMLISLPVIFNADYLLNLWLKEVPDYAVVFTRLTLIWSLIEVITRPLVTVQNATGNVRLYQIIMGSLSLLNVPICILILWIGLSPVSVYYVSISIAILAIVGRLIILQHFFPEFNPWEYVNIVLLNIAIVTILSCIVPTLCSIFFKKDLIHLILSVIVTIMSSAGTIYFIGFKTNERELVLSYLYKIVKKIKK